MRKSLIAIAAALTCVLAGCAVDGTPTRGPIELQTGKYGSMQTRSAGEATSDVAWAKLRAVRLADHMIFAHDLDPVMVDGKLPTQPLATPANVQVVIPDTADLPVMKDFEYGFTLSSGNEKNDAGINHAVMVFRDDAAASAAARQLSDVMLKRTSYSNYERVRVAGMPSESITVHDAGAGGKQTVAAFTPVGQRLIYTWADDRNRSWPERIVKAAYDQQKPLLDALGTVSDDRRIDPDGLLTGTVSEDGDSSNPLHGAVYGQRAAALFYGDQSAALAALKKSGIEQFAWNGTQLYKAGSEGQTAGWIDYLVKDFEDDSSRKAASPQDLNAARCLTRDGAAGCFVAVGPYVGEAYGKDLADAQQQISAQYGFMKKLAG
ncbi:DUF7373 family lipoprotein [Gordonia liuliyuniae]|uniref:Uncharacterized protein n=1 Tax=Gordonia liuliyuniae TaxID=2911517 RepID=A0ABS9IR01_9ACTN|nr:hypothetical protein [Gordonia liuliyuniae]MCF8587950.1 hypothetical protein [Gordonia liuliyuniae]